MIEISIQKKPTYVIEVQGHAGYAEEGKDIVCAAVSTLSYFVYVYAEKARGIQIDQCAQETGAFRISMDITDRSAEGTLQAIVEVFSELERQYPSHIKLVQCHRGEI